MNNMGVTKIGLRIKKKGQFYNNPTKTQMRQMITSKMAKTAIGHANPAVAKPNDLKSFVATLSPDLRSSLIAELTSQLLSA